ncbi:MAG: hypothetical protein HKP27_15100 [Myxococcales bacterium]|nr:hypothetical protein [Myxococcales bacterium]
MEYGTELTQLMGAVRDGKPLPEKVSPRDRRALADFASQVFPFDSLVPEVYAGWRPLVRDAFHFFAEHLTAERLLPKLQEQMKLPSSEPLGSRLLRLIARMPTLQKLGQVVARNPHLAPELRVQLSTLENGIDDLDLAEARCEAERQLGDRMGRYAIELGGKLAEGSVAVVMTFSWLEPESGERREGVFKVLKPYVREFLEEELELLAELADLLEERRSRYGLGALAFRRVFHDVRELLAREIEFTAEQAELAAATRRFAGFPGVRVPSCMPQLCTESLTAMSLERGQKITEFASAPPRERRRIGERLVAASLLWPLFVEAGEGVLHADPHAGNLFWDSEQGTLILLDWALVEKLEGEERRHAAKLGAAVLLRDETLTMEALDRLCPEYVKRKDRRERAAAVVADVFQSFPVSSLPSSRDILSLLDALARAGVEFPGPLVILRKVLFTLEGVLASLDASVSLESTVFSAEWLSRLLPQPAPSIAELSSRIPRVPFRLSDWLDVGWSAGWLPYRLSRQVGQRWAGELLGLGRAAIGPDLESAANRDIAVVDCSG